MQRVPAYPFDEFCKHLEEITPMLDEKRVEDEEPSFYDTLGYVSGYMARNVANPEEQMYKASRFCLIMHFVSTHVAEFDREDFAVYGSTRVGGLIGEHLLRAAHELLTREPLADTTPVEVMELAT